MNIQQTAKIVSYLFLLLIIIVSPLQAGEIRVTLKGDALTSAPLYAELVMADKTEWESPIQQLQINISDKNPVFSFVDISEDFYAIRLFLDLDANGELNLTRRGMPLEPIGFSFCKPAKKSVPRPMDCSFFHDKANTEIEINLIHLQR